MLTGFHRHTVAPNSRSPSGIRSANHRLAIFARRDTRSPENATREVFDCGRIPISSDTCESVFKLNKLCHRVSTHRPDARRLSVSGGAKCALRSAESVPRSFILLRNLRWTGRRRLFQTIWNGFGEVSANSPVIQ